MIFLTMEKKKLRREKRKKILKEKNNKAIYHDFEKFVSPTNFLKKKELKLKVSDDNLLKVKIPKIFSLIHNPEATLDIYKQLFKSINKPGIKGVYIDHSECEQIEIGASTVMDVFVMNLKEYKSKKIKQFICKGKLPKDEKSKIVLLASGILKSLEFPDVHEQIERIKGNKKIECLDLIAGGKNSPTFKVNTSLESGIISTNVSDYFEKCLNIEGLGINIHGKSYISELVAETINNCEQHSGDFNQFFTLGHYYSNSNDGYGECQLVIFNFGQTIYEGLLYNSTDETTKENLKRLSDIHNKKGLFKSNIWDEEVLWTLYALQDGVSRVKSTATPDRGTGTVQLIKSFQEIGSNSQGKNAEMCIISGSSYIHFDGTYKIKQKPFENDDRDIIAFNENNDLNESPDKKFVRKLNSYFPGTIISMTFYIDKEFIIRLKEERNEKV